MKPSDITRMIDKIQLIVCKPIRYLEMRMSNSDPPITETDSAMM